MLLSNILLILEGSALYDAINRLRFHFDDIPGFVKVALKAIQDKYTRSISIDDCISVILRAPHDELRNCKDDLQKAFNALKPFKPQQFIEALVYVAALSKCGDNVTANVCLKELLEEIPNDERNTQWKLKAALVTEATSIEHAISVCEPYNGLIENGMALRLSWRKNMKNEPNFEIFRQAFSPRVEIAAALDGALKSIPNDLVKLKEACQKLNETLDELGQGYVEDQYRAYYIAMTIFVSLAEWKHAIRNAETDAQRFLNSAQLKASEIDMTPSLSENKQFNEFIEQVRSISKLDSLKQIQDQLTSWSLPLLLFANLRDKNIEEIRQGISSKGTKENKTQESTVAFLKFDIDGEPAQQWNYLKPGTAYDLNIEVRVSNWPKVQISSH